MTRISRISAVSACALALSLPFALSGCSGEDEQAAAAEAARATRLAELEQQKETLDAARAELAEVEERLRQAEAGEDGEADPAQLRSEIQRQDAELTTAAEDLNGALTTFINEVAQEAAVGPGEPMPEAMRQAIALKAEEDMTLAREFITEGGDYARAIDMYGAILNYDPENQRVKDAIAEAEAMRYMTQERFSQVKNGMTQAEVEELLGPVNARNRREYPEQGIIAWYYPKSAARDAAGVWFRQRGDRWEVYKLDFDAVSGQGEEG